MNSILLFIVMLNCRVKLLLSVLCRRKSVKNQIQHENFMAFSGLPEFFFIS